MAKQGLVKSSPTHDRRFTLREGSCELHGAGGKLRRQREKRVVGRLEPVEGHRIQGRASYEGAFVVGTFLVRRSLARSKVSFAPNNHNGSKFVDLTIISRDQRFVR